MIKKGSREIGIANAGRAAERAGEDWRVSAFRAFKHHARQHRIFTTEEVRFDHPEIFIGDADPRAWGAIAQAAKRAGIIEFAGYAPVSSSNGSPKVLWRARREAR